MENRLVVARDLGMLRGSSVGCDYKESTGRALQWRVSSYLDCGNGYSKLHVIKWHRGNTHCSNTKVNFLVLILYDIYARCDYLGTVFKGYMGPPCTIFATSSKSLFQNKKLRKITLSKWVSMIQKIQSCPRVSYMGAWLEVLRMQLWVPDFPRSLCCQLPCLKYCHGHSSSCGRLVVAQDNATDSRNLSVSHYFMNLIWADWTKRVLGTLRSTLLLPWVPGGLFSTKFLSPLHIITLLPPS